jgi:alkaline phosphatase D
MNRFVRFGALLTAALLISLSSVAQKAEALLRSGPMLGHVDLREATVWLQTTAPATVQVAYWEKGKPQTRQLTDPVVTSKANGLTAHLVADRVEPGIRYEYEVLINSQKVTRPYPTEFATQPVWLWRKPAPEFTFAFGTCTYVNEPEYDRPGPGYGGGYEIFERIAEKKPEVMIWGGDNSYLREADWGSRTGIYRRFSHDRSIKEIQPLIASAANYAIWDDHDFGPNDSDHGYALAEVTRQAFQDFWSNPSYGRDGKGIYTSAVWSDVQFFFMDNRSFRTNNARLTVEERTHLGKEQFEWLIDNLKYSVATFKIVIIGGQVINPLQVFENYSKVAPEERQRLINTIRAERIPGVMFFTGDRHHTELSKLTDPSWAAPEPSKFPAAIAPNYPLYDLTCSPLTSGPVPAAANEANPTRVPGTFVGERNFALCTVSGEPTDRKLKITIYSTAGKELWTQTISATELQVK